MILFCLREIRNINNIRTAFRENGDCNKLILEAYGAQPMISPIGVHSASHILVLLGSENSRLIKRVSRSFQKALVTPQQ